MVKLTQYTAKLITLCFLWLIVRFTQYLLQVCDRAPEYDAVSNAEMYLQLDIQATLRKTAPEFMKV